MFRLSYHECTDYHNELIKKAEIERLVKKSAKSSENTSNFWRVMERLFQERIQTS